MSAKPIHESKAKELLFKYVKLANLSRSSSVVIDSETNWQELEEKNAWLTSQKLVVKPDQLIKRRGKLGLIKTNASLNDVKSWIAERIGVEIAVGNAHGKLKRFLVERHVDHEEKDEYYVCILSHRDGDTIMFHHEGGINVGDVDAKARTLNLSVDQKPSQEALLALVVDVPEVRKSIVSNFITELYTLYVDLHFTYLEINPLVVTDSQLFVLDVAARIDQCADYLCGSKWGEIEWPAPFGREQLPEEAYIAKLDAGGASLKLTVLNKAGRVWTMVAGGGASVIYADTICDLGFAHELANYGEYSGAPSEQQTYEYAQTVLSLMTQTSHPDGKVLLIGGGIANFTNIATTFKGIIRALQNFKGKLIEHKVSIFVRRAGPNYQEGLRMMRDCGETLGVPVHVFGPETHMTAIVAMALGKREIPRVPPPAISTTANFLLGGAPPTAHADPRRSNSDTGTAKSAVAAAGVTHGEVELPFGSELFSANTKVVIWGMQSRAAQLMFDFDYVCRRKEPSLVAMTYPFVEDHKQKFYWGHKEIMIPVHKLLADCLAKHADATVLINFASHRSAFDISMEVLNKHPQIRVLVIIAEGIPENLTRRMNKLAREKGVAIIGPATVGAIKPGCLKVANTGGMMDNVLASKLYRPGSVAYVSRSGGMSNELNNIMAMHTDGVFEGVAIGGDRYPATTFLDHVLRYQAEDQVKLIVMLGEVGGVEEYSLIEARRTGKLTKPVVAWCTGTCAPKLTSDVQFGHAGAFAAGDRETAFAKTKPCVLLASTCPTRSTR